MKRSPRLFLGFVVSILGAGVPVVSADPVTITSGSISVLGPFQSSPVRLEGTDGVRPFSFTGSISSASSLAVRGCTPCDLTATMLSLSIQSNGVDVAGMLTYGADQYRVGNLADTFGNVSLTISGAALLPPPPSMINQLASITGPFTLERALFQPPIAGGPFGSWNTLLGSGLATVSLFVEDLNGGFHWSLSSAEYRFTPEPASFLLMLSGLVGVASRVRTRKLASQP